MTYKKRLYDLIEHYEDSIDEAKDIPFPKKVLDLFMHMDDKEEAERLASDIQQMFRHLRRNCSWFFEE